jgi:predicted O-linked N-acetylglucosamine transferase (SPINDLY family)
VALRLAGCKWPVIAPWERVDRKTLMRSIHPLSMCVYTDDPLLQLASAERYVRTAGFEGPHSPDLDRRHAPIDVSKRRLRVGYVSSDLRDHAIGYLMAELFELHDKRAVEVFAYYCGPESKSTLTTRTKAAVEHWIDIKPMSDDEAARRIAADGIDILVDVNGHTRDARTGLFRAPPRACAGELAGLSRQHGHALSPLHHRDDWIIPRESEMYYSEKVVRLPCYQPNDRKRVVAAEKPVAAMPACPRMPSSSVASTARTRSAASPSSGGWRILNRRPNSVLWLLETFR